MAGLLQFRTNAEVDRMEAERRGEVEEPVDPYAGLMTDLDAYVERCWQSAFNAKSEIEREMLQDLYRRMGRYSPEKLAEIEEVGAPPVYMGLVSTKVRALEGWLLDIIMPAGDRPFAVEPTPVPNIPPEVKARIQQYIMAQFEEGVALGAVTNQQEMMEAERNMYDRVMSHVREDADRRAARMTDKVDDYAWEGDWYEALENAISDLAVYHNCFIKGPVLHNRKKMQWGFQGQLNVEQKPTPVFYCVSPFNIYPSPNSRGIGDGYLFERCKYRRSDLYAMIGLPGVNEAKMRAALDEYQHGHSIFAPLDTQLKALEYQSTWQTSPDQTIDLREFHGWVRGEWLIEWGYDPMQVPDADAEYQVELWTVGRHTVRVAINSHPLGKRPYHTASFDRRPGSFWGWGGLVRTIATIDDMCNACARALAFNMGISSGPQVVVEVDRLAEGADITTMHPWKIWQVKQAKTNTSNPAVDFFTPDNQAHVLQSVFDYFSSKADEYTGIPSYATGIPTSTGAAGTASGMSMLMSMASRQMKRVVANIDGAIESSIDQLFTYIMLFDEELECKGDSYVVARGAHSLMVKEQQQMRMNEFLMNTNNPTDMEITGIEGRAEVLRSMVRNFDIPADKIVPNREQIVAKAREAMMQQLAVQGTAKAVGNTARAQAVAPDGMSPQGGGDAALFQQQQAG